MALKLKTSKAAKTATEEADREKEEKEMMNHRRQRQRAASKKHYKNLSAEKKAVVVKRKSETNKSRYASLTHEQRAVRREKNCLRMQKVRNAAKKGTKLKPGDQSITPIASSVPTQPAKLVGGVVSKISPDPRWEQNIRYSLAHNMKVPKLCDPPDHSGGKDGFFGRVSLLEWQKWPVPKKRRSSPYCYMCQYCGVVYWDGKDCEIHERYRHGATTTDVKTIKEQGMIYYDGPKRALVVNQLKKCVRK